ncbi:MAG: HAMP domain-containing protein, partial [Nitrospira sp.]
MAMRCLKDAKVATKLMLAFGGLTVLVLILGIVSSRTMFRLTETVRSTHESLVVPLIHEHTLRKEIYELRLAMLAFTRNIGNPEAMARFEAAALRQEETITRKGENLSALAKTPDELRLGKVWQGLWATCIEAHREVLRAGKAGQVDRAWQIIQGIGEHGTRFGDHYSGMLDLAGQRMKLKEQESQALMEHSLQQMTQATSMVYGICLAAVILSVGLTFLITRALARPLIRMVAALQAFSGGEYSSRVAISAQDEVGRLGAAFNHMAEQIETSLTQQQEANRVMMRLKTAMENAGVNIMMADAQDNVIFVNKAAAAALKALESELRKYLPGFEADKIVGGSIHRYHKNPDAIKDILRKLGPGDVRRGEITPGPFVFAHQTRTIFDEQGQKLGSLVEWRDATMERKAQSEVQRLIAAAVEGRLAERTSPENFEGFYRSLAEGINHMLDAFVDRLTRVVGVVKDSSESISTGSGEVSQGTEDLSRRTSEQA